MSEAPRSITSALYVDFDNMYGGLAQLDQTTAEAFAADPGRLLTLLGQGRDNQGCFERRFLVRDCYLNPHSFSRYRAQFVAAGFRVIDCPSLTQRGKSAADTHIVIDVVDAISHATRYDEFIICSADADFTPLMTKLRRHDRRTVMVATGNAAPAYEAVCDTIFTPMDIAAAFGPRAPAPQRVTLEDPADTVTEIDTAAAIAAVRQRVADSETTAIPGPAAAAAARAAVAGIAEAGWGTAGGFAAFVRAHAPELTYVTTDSGGLVVDPARHDTGPQADVDPDPDDPVSRVARVTKTPRLSQDQYAVRFAELETVAHEQPRLTRIGYDVRERAAASEAPVPRKAVDFVVTGLVYSGSDPRTMHLTARQLAETWLSIVLGRCQQAAMSLTSSEEAAVRNWIVGRD